MPPYKFSADADFSMQSAIIFGISSSELPVSQTLRFRCPSSHCKFPSLSSLAVCSECSDLASHLSRTTDSFGYLFDDLTGGEGLATRPSPSNNTEFRLPSGLYINNVEGTKGEKDFFRVLSTMRGTTNASDTVTMEHVDTLIWAQSILKVKSGTLPLDWPNVIVQASECALYYCVKNYTTEVRNGTLIESSSILIDERRSADSWQLLNWDDKKFGRVPDSVADSIAFNPAGSYGTRSDLRLGTHYNISQDAVEGTSAFMQQTFSACLGRGICHASNPVNWTNPLNGFYSTQP